MLSLRFDIFDIVTLMLSLRFVLIDAININSDALTWQHTTHLYLLDLALSNVLHTPLYVLHTPLFARRL
jgi:hypothetical protein